MRCIANNIINLNTSILFENKLFSIISVFIELKDVLKFYITIHQYQV